MDYQLPQRQKFGVIENGIERPYAYPAGHFRESLNDGSQRLVLAGPSTSYTELIIDLGATLPETLKILYVLVVPRDGTAQSGRYESPEFLTIDEASGFLGEFSEFFECDGRHHLWIACPGHGNIVFDRHNTVYAYGDLTHFESVAEAHGMSRKQFSIPVPHWHAYHAEYDAIEHRLLKRWDWIYSPLGSEDDE